MAVIGLLVPGDVNLGTSIVASLAGVPVTLTLLTALAPPGQAGAIAFLLATLYSCLARGIWQGSTMALGLSLVLLLSDLGGGVLAAFGASGEVPPGLVVVLAAVFFGPRLGLIYLISTCLNQKRDDLTALRIGALAQGLVGFLVDPIGWLFYRAERSAAQGQGAPRNQVDPIAEQAPGRTGEESGFD